MADKLIFEFEIKAKMDKAIEEIEEVKEGTKEISENLKGMKAAGKVAEKGLKGIAKGFKGIGLAMKAGGFFLITEAFKFLKDIMMKNQRVMDTVTIATEALSSIFNTLFSVVLDLGESLMTTFSNPKQAISDLWELIKTNLWNRLLGLQDYLGAFATILEGVFTLDWDKVKEGASDAGTAIIQLSTGLDEVQQSKIADVLIDGAKALIEVGTEAVKTATKITALRNEVIGLEADQRLLNFTYLKEQESQRQIRDDVTKTLDVRIAANDALLVSLEKQLADEQRILNKKLELAQKEAAANTESVELAAAVTDQLAELADLEERINGFRSEQMTNEVSLKLEQKEILDELKLAELSEKEAEFETLQQDYDRKLEMARIAGVSTLALEEQFKVDSQTLTDKYIAIDVAATTLAADKKIAADKKVADAEKLLKQQKLDGLKQGLSMAADMFGKSEKDQKRFALAKIGIDTAESISSLMAVSEANPLNAVSFGSAGMIQWALGLLRIFGNVRSAKKLLTSGSTTTTPPPPSTGGGGGGGSTPAVTPQIDTSSMFDLSASTSIFTEQPLQAFVVQQDIEDQTEISNQIQNRATL